MSKLGDKVKRLRELNCYSLEQLGNLTGSSKSYIWDIENSSNPNPSLEKLLLLARALRTTVEYLVADIDASQAAKDAFFNKFNKLSAENKAKVEQIIYLWGEDE